jgi:ATP-dependent RNA helicase DeaD
MTVDFKKFGLQEDIMQAIVKMGFEQPTPIQQSAIPMLMEGFDVIGQAQTGTGKTAAFMLPMLHKIKPGCGHIQGLVLAPTRELALQVADASRQMASDTNIKILAVYGGQSYTIQKNQLKHGVDIVVGTPGRLMDLMRQKCLDLSKIQSLVLDEADEMLEMGFVDDVETILSSVPAERQMALFSATMPDAIRKLAQKYQHDPKEIAINPTRMTVAETEQRFYKVREEDKLGLLMRILELEETKSALIFTRTKARAQELADEMNRRGVSAESLHGDLNQTRREYVLNRFRKHQSTLLVATDVAARGLDVEDVTHVINFDVPNDPEDYVHRIGRTGRAGRKGIAITFLIPKERRFLSYVESYTHQSVKEMPIPTREEIIARRDERFLQRLTERLGKGSISHERSLIAKLTETTFDPIEIAAAAIQLARLAEGELSLEEITPVKSDFHEVRKSSAKSYQKEDFSRKSNRKDRTNNTNGTAKENSRQPSNEPFNRPRRNKGQEPGMVRLVMNLGNAQGVRPSDIVGAIASETGIPGKAIGAIDIRSDFSFVDVSENHVRKVLNGNGGRFSMRGKSVLLTLAN